MTNKFINVKGITMGISYFLMLFIFKLLNIFNLFDTLLILVLNSK